MTGQQLKNSILQLAVQGKLVPQDPADEPASILLERIREEKEQLIKDGKIKKEKNPSQIFRGEGDHFYERIGKAEPICIDDELPFEIPESWEWARLGGLAFVTKLAGFEYTKYIAPNLITNGIPLFKGKNIQNGQLILDFESYIDEKISDELSRSQLTKKCLLTPYVGTIGNIAIFPGTFKAHLGSNVGKIELYNSIKEQYVSEEYILAFLKSLAGYDQLTKQKKSTAQESISIQAIREVFIPLPPLSEQQRIVAKIEELMPFVDRYDALEKQLQALNTTFPDQLKKSILQEAIQGKLVPQDPADEPASALLERIRAEKEQLIKDGKIKREKNPSHIFRGEDGHFYECVGKNEPVCIDDQLPFEIPDSWEWSRLNSVGIFSSGKTPSKSNASFWNGTIPWVSSKDMKKPIIADSELHISQEAARNMQLYPPGTLLLVSRSGILRRLLPLCRLGVESTINQDIKAFSLYDQSLSPWLYYAIKAFEPYILKELVKSVTTVESLKFDEFSSMFIPLPPLQEQTRIICAIEKSLALLFRLSSDPLFQI